MAVGSQPPPPPLTFPPSQLDTLLAALSARGYRVVGPTRRDGAIVYDTVSSCADLPAGWTDVQEPGRYRLERRQDQAYFGYNVGPHAWKKFLLPPRQRLWRSERQNGGFVVFPESEASQPVAFLGVRACELHAIAAQDRVLLQGPQVDVHYAARRRRVLVVAVDCGQAGGTCFCTSMGTGPEVATGADIVLTEILEGGHRFVARSATADGAELLLHLEAEPASEADRAAARQVVERAAAAMPRRLAVEGLAGRLQERLEAPHWQRVAERCLACANCTLACPTCFCTNVEDTTDLSGEHAEHTRVWDSCFNVAFSFMHGGAVRRSVASRYRQWLTHKLSTWVDQFGTSGCVGCGRCITWCPAGIDITVEAAAVATDPAGAPAPESRR